MSESGTETTPDGVLSAGLPAFTPNPMTPPRPPPSAPRGTAFRAARHIIFDTREGTKGPRGARTRLPSHQKLCCGITLCEMSLGSYTRRANPVQCGTPPIPTNLNDHWQAPAR